MALLVLGAGPAFADDPALAPNVPDRYVVKKGDTLWGIAARFLRDPWRWPDLWHLNRDQIKNPHWIYPGDVLVLERGVAGAPPQLHLERGTVRVSPTIRSTPLDTQAIQSIPPGDIEPYLSRPLVTGPAGLSAAAQIVAGRDARVNRGNGDTVYVIGLDRAAGDFYYIYRPGSTLTSWDNPDDVLGYEQRFLGTAKIERFDNVSTARIATASEEILVGDRLIPAPREQIVNYVPHAPATPIDGHIIELNRGADEAGRGWLVTIDKGAADGLDIGAVLAINRLEAPIVDPRGPQDPLQLLRFVDRTTVFQPESYLDLPVQRIGLMFVYRVFERVSFAVLLDTTDPVAVGDAVNKP